MTCTAFRPADGPASGRQRRLLLAFAALPLLAGAPSAEPPPDACPDVPACIERMIGIGTRQGVYPVQLKLQSFGPAAVDALIPLLRHEDRATREVAGMTLASFERIDPRHLPALTAAYEGRHALPANRWLPRAIAAAGSEEALTYLQKQALEQPDFVSQSQLHMALGKFGDRARPFILAQLEACRTGAPEDRCRGIMSALGYVAKERPAWAVEAILALATAAEAVEGVRGMGEDFAIERRHPLGLRILERRLEAALSPDADGSDVEYVLDDIGDYGTDAASFGPRVASLLASQNWDIRAEAALTLGRIGSRSGAEALVALEPAFDQDWILAYNVVESLGRLRVQAARPLLRRVAAGYWHRGVRNNAGRALNSLGGGEFARPGVAGDADPYRVLDEAEGDLLYFGPLRFAADAQTRCALAAEPHPFRQDPPARISWPAKGAVRLDFLPLADSVARQMRTALGPIRTRGRIPFLEKTRSGGLITGYDQGEWGGALVHIRPDASREMLEGGNAKEAFRIGRRLYVLQGLSHGVGSSGKVAVIVGDPPRVERLVRLPAEPEEVLATSRRAVLIRTGQGDIAIGEDGRLADPDKLGLCPKGKS